MLGRCGERFPGEAQKVSCTPRVIRGDVRESSLYKCRRPRRRRSTCDGRRGSSRSRWRRRRYSRSRGARWRPLHRRAAEAAKVEEALQKAVAALEAKKAGGGGEGGAARVKVGPIALFEGMSIDRGAVAARRRCCLRYMDGQALEALGASRRSPARAVARAQEGGKGAGGGGGGSGGSGSAAHAANPAPSTTRRRRRRRRRASRRRRRAGRRRCRRRHGEAGAAHHQNVSSSRIPGEVRNSPKAPVYVARGRGARHRRRLCGHGQEPALSRSPVSRRARWGGGTHGAPRANTTRRGVTCRPSPLYYTQREERPSMTHALHYMRVEFSDRSHLFSRMLCCGVRACLRAPEGRCFCVGARAISCATSDPGTACVQSAGAMSCWCSRSDV